MTKFLKRLVAALRLLKLEERVATLEGNLLNVSANLRHQMDILKSSIEVPKALIDEFEEWKTHTLVSQEPLVSVCIATYNRAELLTKRSVPSVLGQTYTNLELIVVGDGCTDDTQKLLEKVQDHRLIFINLPSRGKYPEDPLRRWMVAGTMAMNRAMGLAQGEYITHLDDDDEFLPDRLERLVAFTLKNKCDFVWHPFWWERAPGVWELNTAERFMSGHVTTSSIFYRQWLKKIEWNVNAHLLLEPGDWNRLRRMLYIAPVAQRYPEPLLRHYLEQTQATIS